MVTIQINYKLNSEIMPKSTEITHGWVAMPRSQSNGTVTGNLAAFPSGITVNDDDLVMKVQVHKNHCTIKGGEIRIHKNKVGQVVKKFTPTEFKHRVLKVH